MSIPNPMCWLVGHYFDTIRGKTFCQHCGKVVR